jgi:proteasome lid subunit RPN8/RPN11
MNWLSEEEQQVIRLFSAAAPEQESCGFVLSDGAVVSLANTAENTIEQFRIDPADYARLEPLGIRGVWHSHLELDAFSATDQQVMRADVLPWAVYCLRTDRFHQCDPLAVAPYVGRPFVYGIYDCYSLVRNYLAQEHDIHLPVWQRHTYGEWNERNFTPFDEEFPKYAKRLPSHLPLQDGDVVGMNLGSNSGHTDHIGIINSDRLLLHHLAEKESRVDVFGGIWQRQLRWVMRPVALWR